MMSSGKAQALCNKSFILSSLAAHRLKILAPATLGTKDRLWTPEEQTPPSFYFSSFMPFSSKHLAK